ncbi:hypothetical protein GQ457_02G029020 [Hibiscus cannabinus]
MGDTTTLLSTPSSGAGEDEEILLLDEDAVPIVLYAHCFVGYFLTTTTVHFQSMRTTVENVWHPIGGISISELGALHYLFHRIDAEGPWYFNTHLLVMYRLKVGDNPMMVPISHVGFWVLVHDVPHGCMMVNVAKQLGNFVGVFTYYDTKAISFGDKGIMWIRVFLDVRLPLKRQKKLTMKSGSSGYKLFAPLGSFRRIGSWSWHGMPLCAPLRRNQIQSSLWLLEDNISGIEQFGIYKSNFPVISRVNSISRNFGPTFPPNHASRDCVTPAELEARFLQRLRSSAPVIDSSNSSNTRLMVLNVKGLRFLTREDLRPTVVFFIETKLPDFKMAMVRRRCGFSNGIDVSGRVCSGGISLVWTDDVKVSLQSFTVRHIDVVIEDEVGNRKWRCFRSALADCSLDDIGYFGQWFTWETGVDNESWLVLFPNYRLEHLVKSLSHPCPLLLSTDVQILERPLPQFRFEAAWLLQESSEATVCRLWSDSSEALPGKLFTLAQGLSCWFKNLCRSKKATVAALQQQLEQLYDLPVSDAILEEIMGVKVDLNIETDREEVFWKQRERVKWLRKEDHNTQFFHSYTSHRRKVNRIDSLLDDDGKTLLEMTHLLP